MSASFDKNELCLLSLDGGGVRGLSTLYILKALMQKLALERYGLSANIQPPIKPYEVFDLIGGTSSGGLIAILLGKLRLDCAIAWREYADLLTGLADIKHEDLYSHSNYAEILQEILQRHTQNSDTRMGTSEGPGAGTSAKVSL